MDIASRDDEEISSCLTPAFSLWNGDFRPSTSRKYQTEWAVELWPARSSTTRTLEDAGGHYAELHSAPCSHLWRLLPGMRTVPTDGNRRWCPYRSPGYTRAADPAPLHPLVSFDLVMLHMNTFLPLYLYIQCMKALVTQQSIDIKSETIQFKQNPSLRYHPKTPLRPRTLLYWQLPY